MAGLPDSRTLEPSILTSTSISTVTHHPSPITVTMAPAAYAKDERVLCFHHELLYEAKILESRPVDASDKKSPLEYRVHYKGWKNT